MTEDQIKEKLLKARDNINTSIRNLRIDRIVFFMLEYLMQDADMPFQINDSDKYAFFLQANANFANDLKTLYTAWKELEELQDIS
ncbi:MAG: hypothetical protein E7624_05865 [Ruminococcaceae bacterium]|nr:hypothetical protein [Oscillospiraceae bacterium]